MVAFAATLASAGVGSSPCSPGRWLEDPGISPAVLDANGYRVVASQTLDLGGGRQAIEWISVRDGRMAKCRTVYVDAAAPAPADTVCFLRCRTP